MSIKRKEVEVPSNWELIKASAILMFGVSAILFPFVMMVILGMGTASLGVANMHQWFLLNDTALVVYILGEAVPFTATNTVAMSIFFIIVVEIYKFGKRKEAKRLSVN